MHYQNFLNFNKTTGKFFVVSLALFLLSFVAFGGVSKLYAQEGTDEQTTQQTTGTENSSDTNDVVDDTNNEANADSDTNDENSDTAEVDTGDATADADSTNSENTNQTDTDTDTPDGTDTTVTNDNEATSTTDANVDAETGDNEATASGDATVNTGNAVASANVVNVINTNVFNSVGMFYFLNMIMGNISLDMRDMFSILTGNAEVEGGCALDDDECLAKDTTVTINNTNNAVVNNDVTVTANTGSNTASSENGDASVSTGDAYASANVVNIVNTNITDTNYLLLTVNSFNSRSGNIIFPGADWFNDLLSLRGNNPGGSQTTVTNTNNAEVNNNIGAVSDTGNNTASGTDETNIDTGNAVSNVNVVNKVNTNIFGNSLTFLFKVPSSWAGQIFGLPDGMSWRKTKEGVEIFFDGETATAPAGSTDNMTVTNTNNAEVNNNVSVFALTGDNMASSESGNSSIETGDATAGANVVNVVNSNVLGRNWVLAVFNIFGNWNGNISFGQPDLWVGARALDSSRLRAGSCFNYEVTVSNLGDATANNVVLHGIYNKSQEKIDRLTERTNSDMAYDIGRIVSGGTSVVTLPVCLTEFIPGKTDVNTTFVATEDEDDSDDANNTEVIGVTTVETAGGALRLGPAKLSITKTVDKKEITASSTVTYEITIKNTGDPVYNALLVDTIYDEDGNSIHEQRWGLETIRKHETIIVSYSAFFNENTAPGTYTNEAFISGTEGNKNYQKHLGKPVHSPVASADVEVVNNEDGNVEKACLPLLTTYIRREASNNKKEVGELQFFLKTMEGFEDVKETNEYDDATYNAVRKFQTKYADEILTPWGMSTPSGFVYYTTQKKINEIWCKDMDFSLSEKQKSEIEAFKNRKVNFVERHVENPDGTSEEPSFERYGLAPQNTNDESGTYIALNDSNENENQTANALMASQNEQIQKWWNKIQNNITNAFSWLSF